MTGSKAEEKTVTTGTMGLPGGMGHQSMPVYELPLRRPGSGAGVPPAMWHGHPAHDSDVARASSSCSAGVPPAGGAQHRPETRERGTSRRSGRLAEKARTTTLRLTSAGHSGPGPETHFLYPLFQTRCPSWRPAVRRLRRNLLVQSFSPKRRASLASMFSLITGFPFWRQRCGVSLWTGIATSRFRCW
ncbi:hypothetical protein OpiT1DRAFT_03801 [Opitutaceae bacterium TAV1]|nr:hypothetical protein OpiT1DRAFT_03801 [Opitutaceae bacterium TAV1]